MQANQSPLDVAGRIFAEFVPVLERSRPDCLVVQGEHDHGVRRLVGRVSRWCANLRTSKQACVPQTSSARFLKKMNRRLTSVLADMHFAPTALAQTNLLAEGIDPASIFVTGNPIVDAVESILRGPVDWNDSRLEKIEGRFVLVTAHRRESFGPTLLKKSAPP